MWSTSKTSSIIGVFALLGTGGCRGIVDPEANATLLRRLGNTSFTVFPAAVRGEDISYDQAAAQEIGVFLTDDGLAEVTVSREEVPITGSWGMNEANMLRESAEDFAAYLYDHPIDTEYAILAEYLFGGRGSAVGIHCYVLDKAGRVAWTRLWNSHHKEEFAEATLTTAEDCTELLVQELRSELEPAGTDE